MIVVFDFFFFEIDLKKKKKKKKKKKTKMADYSTSCHNNNTENSYGILKIANKPRILKCDSISYKIIHQRVRQA